MTRHLKDRKTKRPIVLDRPDLYVKVKEVLCRSMSIAVASAVGG